MLTTKTDPWSDKCSRFSRLIRFCGNDHRHRQRVGWRNISRLAGPAQSQNENDGDRVVW
jgi:hypothetical protein